MNGEHKQIYDAIRNLEGKFIELDTKQTERHAQNRKDMDCLGEVTRSLEKHCHEIGKLKVHRAVHWVILTAIAASIVLVR